MEVTQRKEKVANTTLKKKRPVPQVRQTLTSKYRMLKANPLLAYELKKKLPLNSTSTSVSKENLLFPPIRALVEVLDSTVDPSYKFSTTVNGFTNQTVTSNVQLNHGKNVQKKEPQKTVSKPLQNTRNLKFSTVTKAKETKNLQANMKKATNLPEKTKPKTKELNKREISATTIVTCEDRRIETYSNTLNAAPITPSAPARRTTMFKTPSSVLQDITTSKSRRTTFNTPNRQISGKNDCQEISKRLKEWLTTRGKNLGDYHHLKCFGVHTPKTKQPEVVEKENIIETDPVIVTKVEEVDLLATAKGALQDLHQLILDGYSDEQCEMWLQLIKVKCSSVVNEPHYWECRAALEQTKGNIQLAVECYKTAIVQGAETQRVDKSLDQLLQKFNLLNIDTEASPSVNNKTKIVQDIRNIFKSSIIQFAVQEKNIKKKNKEGITMEKHFIATPVRRSTRLSRSAFTSTPGIHIYSSLKDVDEDVRSNISFQCNAALNN